MFSGAVEAVVPSAGRGRKVSILLYLASFASMVGLVLLVAYPSERLQVVRFRYCFDHDKEPAWFYTTSVG
ncbi:MAG: hypothetical protein M3N45_12720 [Actinomycetota bacterium]|nr:hypothetical protein [Actinomycetota bacterium]